MVEPSRKKSKKGTFSGNHQRSWLWGHHAVCETLRSGKWPVIEIFATPDAFEQSSALLLAKRKEGVPVDIVAAPRLEQLSRSTEHQGLVARLGEFPYQTQDNLERMLRQAITAHANQEVTASGDTVLPPLVVICDRIQDTFNFGAILRCCDGASVIAVIIGDHCQADVTPHVARSSSGAVNHIPIIKVADLFRAAEFVKQLGLQLIAADANAKTSVWNSKLSGATALVIGSEAHGIEPEFLAICDQRVCIPMQGQVTSLNAAVAAGILLYEIRRQQLSHLH
jgi:23S rRNA (guanosine2251-2'-O)-methyltransferase